MKNPIYFKTIITFFSLLLMPFSFIAAQEEKRQNIYSEEPEDAYIYVPREGRSTSPAYRVNTPNFSIHQVNVNKAGENMLGDAANEPSIAIDPNNPDRMVIGWRQFDTISSNFRQAGNAYTLDGGETWVFSEPIEAGVFRSDPVLDFDMEGNFYYNSLSSDNGNFFCHVFQSEENQTWDLGTFAYGGDKQWMVIDRTSGSTNGNIYAFWKAGLSNCTGSFTQSLDGGQTFEACEHVDNNPTRGTLTVGPNGELYACGEYSQNSFSVIKSTNVGIVGENLNWETSLVNLGGQLSLYDGPNPSGMLGQAWIQTDHSDTEYRGNVYLLATINSSSSIDKADIILARSSDGGETWSEAIRINDDASEENWQWFGTLSVAPNGRVDVLWLDTREYPGAVTSALYYSNSFDGGETWSANEKLSEAFDPHLGWPNQEKIGDYYHSISDNNGVHLAWAATFNGEQDVYYSYIQVEEPLSKVENKLEQPFQLLQNTPNPFQEQTAIHYSLDKKANVVVDIVNIYGKVVETLVAEHQIAGTYQVFWNTKNKVSNGVYFYRLKVGVYGCMVRKLIKN